MNYRKGTIKISELQLNKCLSKRKNHLSEYFFYRVEIQSHIVQLEKQSNNKQVKYFKVRDIHLKLDMNFSQQWAGDKV